MCDFGIGLAIASTAITAASASLAYVGQRQQAANQDRQAVQVAQSANTSYRFQQQQLQSRLIQQRASIVQQVNSDDIDAARLQASERVSAAEQGVSGVSLQAILGQTDRELGNKTAINQRNLQLAQLDEIHQEQSAYYTALDRRNSVPFGQYPSLLTPILQTAGAGLNAYGQYLYKPSQSSQTLTAASYSSNLPSFQDTSVL